MAAEIARSLADIDQKVKALNKTLRASGEETRELDKALKLDPKNIDLSTQKMTALQSAVGTATQKVAIMRQKQDEANRAFQNGDISAAEYKKIETAVVKAENEVRVLNKQIAETQQMRVDQTAASFDKLSGKLGKAKDVAKSFSKVALGLVAALGAAAAAFIKIGDELHDTSKKFRITAEELQLQRNLFARTTSDAKNYDRALSSMNSVMTKIARGSGAAYLDTLQRLGVSTTDASGRQKTAAQVYNETVEALRLVTDDTERAALACILFGENGLNVAMVAELTNAEVREYNEALIENGLISNEAAAKADEMATKMNEVKQQLQAASAELMIALLPLIEALVEILQTTIIPILTKIANWFANMSPWQQKFVFFLLILIILLPKIIGMTMALTKAIKAIAIAKKKAAVGAGALSAASMPLQPILIAVAAAILIVVLLLLMLSGKSKDVTKQLNQQKKSFDGMAKSYDGMAGEMGGTVAMTSQNSSTQTVNYDVNINAHGDTPISQEAAEMIADDLAAKINANLGGKI